MQTPRWFLGCSLLATAALAARGAPHGSDPDIGRARQVADGARGKVVVVRAGAGTAVDAATGFVVGQRLVLTVGHAVAAASGVQAWVNGVRYRATVLAEHPDHDVAILGLRAPQLLLKPLQLARATTDLERLEKLVILSGDPQLARGKANPSEKVTILATFRQHLQMRDPDGRVGPMLALNASVERGDSGSPVLRLRDGSVIGLLSSRQAPGDDGISRSAYAVPVEAVHRWIDGARQIQRRQEEFYLFGR
jgi:S1-C subfamily serine protease